MADAASQNKTKGTNLQPDSSTSAFRIYALGTVAEDLPLLNLDDDPHQTLEVFLDEIYSAADGKLTAKGQVTEVEGTDSQGKSYQAKAASTTSVSCWWLPFSTNRMTAPAMRKGMRVVVWRTSDEQQLWWEPKGGDDHLMTLDRVIYTWNANPNPDKNAKAIDMKSCWYFDVDTFKKRFTFANSQANGEATQFFFQLDLEKGTFQGGDTVEENMMFWDFINHQLRFQNKEGSFIEILKDAITLFCEDRITAIAKNSIILQSKKIEARAQTIDMIVENYIRAKTPQVIFTGNVTFTGEDGKEVNLTGNFNHKEGTWKAPSGTEVYSHSHGGVERGKASTDTFK